MEMLNIEKKGKINNRLTGNEHDKYYEFFCGGTTIEAISLHFKSSE